jgi:predicted HAD superfamily phosphohydrolase YqeG
VSAETLVFDLDNTTVGYTDDEAPPPDVDFTTSARIMATEMTTPPIHRSTVKALVRSVQLRLPVPI